ncbi:MBL fold metallo-hydrolase [uncultured Butyricimonas sp.]|uniref:MBL fold metallo-hydrolase n=1 Tax=uncultured Butyricimonas sp. TaxID=1268785 RepID=UPI0026DD490C|nr:MBL fold metallo-hydrolase [uncultured Butyricimonas sp.]
MKGIYIYHSGFALLDEGVTVIIDYYKDSANPPLTGVVHGELLGRPGKLYVLASHVHADHFNPDVLTWKHSRPDIQYIFSKDILEVGHVGLWDACYIEKGNVWTDGILEIEAFGSTDAGISFLLRLRGKTVFHAGDLNNWHWKEEATGEEVREAESAYLAELDTLVRRTDSMDLVMFPVDPRLGEDYMLGAKQFIDRFRVGTFVPMHFDDVYDKANAFREYAGERGVRFVSLEYKGEEFMI